MEGSKMLSIVAPGIRICLEGENMRETVYSFLYHLMLNMHMEDSRDVISIYYGNELICETYHKILDGKYKFYVSSKRTYYDNPVDACSVVKHIMENYKL